MINQMLVKLIQNHAYAIKWLKNFFAIFQENY